jgi:hypothetical protein
MAVERVEVELAVEAGLEGAEAGLHRKVAARFKVLSNAGCVVFGSVR